MVQAAHTNWGGGKGRGIKADDNLVAALCLHCHFEIDQGANLDKNQNLCYKKLCGSVALKLTVLYRHTILGMNIFSRI